MVAIALTVGMNCRKAGTLTTQILLYENKAVICIDVKASDETEAKKLAVEKMKKRRDKMFNNTVTLQDDTFKADGVVNMDETWNML